ncbi:CPBP family intramembrane glutamic endopeptidase [Paenibacillus silviterrae]|uniref:CPBP family intramembrane glutamic endopeptidase n=1 Tax=Paenibacillus silviterrae TaxID=3242194 RepID=UPI002543B97E|nr:type II CAAX endopeptidase family protein [Paenibacillus chinjuensis]
MKKVMRVSGIISLAIGFMVGLSILFNFVISIFWETPGAMPEAMLGLKSLFVMLGALAIILNIFERGTKTPLGVRESKKVTLTAMGILFGFIFVLVTFAAVYFVGEVTIITIRTESMLWATFGMLAFLAFCDTLSEEILFRGYFQGLIKLNYGSWISVLVSSIPFTLLHSLGHDIFSHPLMILNLFFGGVFLALLKELSGSLWLPVGFHFAWNSFQDVFGPDNFVTIALGPNEWIHGGSLGFDNGLASNLITLTIIVLLAFQLKKVQSKHRELLTTS